MSFLHEIARIVGNRSQKFFEILDIFPRKARKSRMETKERILFRALLQEKSEEKAAEIVYGAGTATKEIRFRSLKHDLTHRLLSNLFFLNLGSHKLNDRSAARYYCIKGMAQLKILRLFGNGPAVKYVAQGLCPIAKRYSFYDVLVETYNALAVYYSLRGETALFERYGKEELRCSEILAAEKKVQYYRDWCTAHYAAFSSPRPQLLRQISEYTLEANELRKRYDTPQLQSNYLGLARICAEVEQNYEKVIAVAEEAINYFEKYPYLVNEVRRAVFYLSVMAVKVWQAEYEEAYKYIEILEKIYKIGGPNWYYFKEVHLLLALRSGKEQLALEIFRKAVGIPQFDSSNSLMKEKWTLLEFYTRFLTGADFPETLIGEEFDDPGAYFRNFKKMFPRIARDVSGYMLTLAVAHVTYLLSVGDTDGIIISNDALQLFRRRYLSKEGTLFRVGCFLRMINLMVKHNFDAKKTARAAEGLYKKMSGVQEFYRGTAESMEVLPLERLWKMCLGYLETNGELLRAGLADRRERLRREAEERAAAESNMDNTVVSDGAYGTNKDEFDKAV